MVAVYAYIRVILQRKPSSIQIRLTKHLSTRAAGVGALHLVDLDGAKAGKPVNVDIVKRVRAAFTGVLEIGGGIRDKDAVDLYLEMGVNRVILGSVALKILN